MHLTPSSITPVWQRGAAGRQADSSAAGEWRGGGVGAQRFTRALRAAPLTGGGGGSQADQQAKAVICRPYFADIPPLRNYVTGVMALRYVHFMRKRYNGPEARRPGGARTSGGAPARRPGGGQRRQVIVCTSSGITAHRRTGVQAGRCSGVQVFRQASVQAGRWSGGQVVSDVATIHRRGGPTCGPERPRSPHRWRGGPGGPRIASPGRRERDRRQTCA
jgi:hypothetical protein